MILSKLVTALLASLVFVTPAAAVTLPQQLARAAAFCEEEGERLTTRVVTLSSIGVFLLVALAVGAVVVKSWLAVLGSGLG